MDSINLLKQTQWTAWFPRKELSPHFFGRNGNDGSDCTTYQMIGDGNDKIGICAGADVYAFGKWISDEVPVSGAGAVVFEAAYTQQNIEHEAKSIFAMLSFYDGKGKMLERDYVDIVCDIEENVKKLYRKLDLPENAAAVRIELGIINCPQANITWRDISLKMAEKEPARPVKIVTTYKTPCETLQKNLDSMINIIDKAGKENPDVILLSELVYESYVGLPLDELCQPIPGFLTDKIGEYAKKYNTYIIFTMNEKDGDIIYNTAVVIGRNGDVCGKYRKTHLPLSEAEAGTSPGNTHSVFELDFGKIGVLICYDQMFPENARILELMGAEIIFIPTMGEEEILQRAIARANGLYVAVAGYAGAKSSRIIDPLGNIVNFVRDKDEAYAAEEIDLNRRFFTYWMSIGAGNGENKVLFRKERMPGLYEKISDSI